MPSPPPSSPPACSPAPSRRPRRRRRRPPSSPSPPATCPPARRAQRQTVPLVAGGFTPNALVDVPIDGEPVRRRGGQPGGRARRRASRAASRRPTAAAAQRRFTVTLTEQGNPANTVTARVARHRAGGRRDAARRRRRPRGALQRARLHRPGPRSTPTTCSAGRLRETVRMGRPKRRLRHLQRAPAPDPRAAAARDLARAVRPAAPAFTDPPESIFVQLQIRVFPTRPERPRQSGPLPPRSSPGSPSRPSSTKISNVRVGRKTIWLW